MSEIEQGPWGKGMDVVLCLAPIGFLIGVTMKPNAMKSSVSLPLSAGLLWVVCLVYLSRDAGEVNANVLVGLCEAFTPLAIIFGAMLLFEVRPRGVRGDGGVTGSIL